MKPFRILAAACGALLLQGCRMARFETVTIYRDDYGIPNIFAGTEEGAAFGAGYAQAEDRLEELLKQYRRATGTMAEAFGPEHFRDDYRQRLWRHAAVSRERYAEVTARTRAILEAYVDGVRLYMRRHPERVPAWAPEIEPWMIVALGRYIIWGWPEGTAAEDLKRAGIEPDPVEPRASNEWVVSGSRTESGAPMALIDPHLGWYGPFRFYEERLYGGRLEVAGVTILGTPIPSLGHSRYASVAMTTGGPDTSDAYEVTLDPAHPGKYLFDGEWRELKVLRETIRVKKGEALEDVQVSIEYSHHGPIVAHRDGKGYALRIPYSNEVTLPDQTYEMMTARSLDEMKAAIRRFQLMEQNIMVATVDGDIYYVRNGRVPIRPEGHDWTRPVPGSTSRTEWLGIHRLEDLVQIRNPPQGYMQNCNVSPSVMMVDSPLRKEGFASRPYIYNEELPYLHQRAAETRAELHAETRLTVRRAVEIAHSTVVYNAERWQEQLRRARESGGSSRELGDDASRLLQLILDWNRRADGDSTGATAYWRWKEEVYAVPDEVPAEKRIRGESRLGEVARLDDRAGLDPPEVPAAKLLEALEAAAKRLREGWGKLEVPYGEVFRIQRDGSARSFPASGGSLPGMSTPRALSFRKAQDGRTYRAVGGQTATQIVVLTKPPQSFSLLPLGESDDPGSPAFDDQAEKLMQKRDLKPTYFLRKAELLEHVSSTTILERRR